MSKHEEELMKVQNEFVSWLKDQGIIIVCETNEDGTKCDECLAMEDAVNDYKAMIRKEL